MTTDSRYPESKPYDQGTYVTSDGHELYYERHGNPAAAEKVVYLHGGPGAGCSYQEYRWFDPLHFDVLLFDQRWAPKSTPVAGTGRNDIDAAVADIEGLRTRFGHDSWNVAGGSWGTALGALYTVRHPERVDRLLLRAQFFADAAGARHIIEEDGAAATNRNEWFEEYQRHIPAAERANGLLLPYHDRVMRDGPEAYEAARLFTRWDNAIATAAPSLSLIDSANAEPVENLALSRTFFHFAKTIFSERYRTEILAGMKSIGVPTDIVHGRKDYICPLQNALDIHAACRDSRLHIVEDVGHAMAEPALREAFISVTKRWTQESPKPARARVLTP